MRLPVSTLLMLSLTLVACGKAPQNPPAPAVATAPAPAPAAVSTPPASTAAAASTAPASAVAASTLAAATPATSVAPDEATTAGPEVAGQVSLAQGNVTDTATDGSSRQLKDGDSVYPGDSFLLGADSYLDMDLEDSGRILLRPNTSFQIQSYHFDADAHAPTDANGQPLIKPASAQPENAFFKLVKGGLRAVDGLIGQTHPDKYGVETPVATIGVRGTAFDVRYCSDDCSDEADASSKPEDGLYTSVSEGSIGVKNDSGETVTPAGHSGFVKSRKERMQALATPPKALRHMELPDKLKARAEKNRGQIQQRRQLRRQAILEHRRKAAEKAKAGAAQGKPAGQGLKPETPAERREKRLERREGAGKDAPAAEQNQRQQERGEKLRRQEREQQQPAANVQVKPSPEATPANPTRRELRQEKREERQQQKAAQAPAAETGAAKPTRREQREEKHEEHQQQKAAQSPAAAPAAAPGKEAKPAASGDDDKCKDKKKRKHKDDKDKKDKDKCGGD